MEPSMQLLEPNKFQNSSLWMLSLFDELCILLVLSLVLVFALTMQDLHCLILSASFLPIFFPSVFVRSPHWSSLGLAIGLYPGLFPVIRSPCVNIVIRWSPFKMNSELRNGLGLIKTCSKTELECIQCVTHPWKRTFTSPRTKTTACSTFELPKDRKL